MNKHYVNEFDEDEHEGIEERRPFIVRWFWLLYLVAIAVLAVGSLMTMPRTAHAAVSAEWRVNLLKGSSTIDTPTGATEAEAWAKCQSLIPKTATSSTTYRCQTPVFTAIVTPDPVTCPPPPAPTTRTQQCPSGTTGTWTQTSTSTWCPGPSGIQKHSPASITRAGASS